LTQRNKTRNRLLSLISLLIVLTVPSVLLVYTALNFTNLEIERGGRGYITDEVWYVSSSRVILKKIFGLSVKQDPVNYGVNIVFQSSNYAQLTCQNIAPHYSIKTRCDYSKIPAVYVSGYVDEAWSFINEVNKTYPVVDVIPGWQLPDSEGINNYINWEHPPLGKYLIALSMLMIGDYPFYWRIPIISFGVLACVLVYLILYRLTKSYIPSIVGALLFTIDNITRAIYSIAILDGFVATLTLISLYFALKGKYRSALLSAIIAGLFKASGLFTLIPIIIVLARRIARETSGGLGDFIYYTVYYGVLSIGLWVSLLTIVSLPVANYMGVSEWFKQSLLGSISWHLSIKCTGPNCATSSNPWDWFLGYHSFALYNYPDGTTLYAEGYYPLWFTSLILALISIPLMFIRRDYGKTLLYYLGIFAGYIGIWILGSRTQYSFYAIHLAPFTYINLIYLAHSYAEDQELGVYVLRSWYNSIEKIVNKIEQVLFL